MKLNGKLLAFVCLLLWSLSPPLAKIGVGYVGYLAFALLTAAITAIFALPFFIREKGWNKVGENWKQLLVLYLFTYFLFAVLYFFGMESVSAIQGSALLGSEVMFALIVGVLMGKEQLSGKGVLFTLLLMLGIAIAVMNGAFELEVGIGALFILGAMLSLQIGFYNAANAIRNCGVGTIILFGNLFQLLVVLALFPFTGTELTFSISSDAWFWIIVYSALPSFAAASVWYAALKRISVYITTAIVVPAPVVALVFSAILLGETVTIYHIVGMALIVLSVWKITERTKKRTVK